MIKRENELNTHIFNGLRERLLRRYAAKFNSVGADAEDAFAKAFECAARWLLGREGDFTEKDLECLVVGKMNFLFRDALASAKRDHGRRSVKLMAILDGEQESGDECRVAMVDRWSMTRYAEASDREGGEARILLQAKAIDCVLRRHGVSPRNRDIFDRCLYCHPDRKALAAEYQTSVGNIGRVKCECGKLAIECAPEIRSCYAALARQYECQIVAR